ncbi:SCF E3 ubiquitin ligase complex F-box protein grrA-like [Aphidius gifuensis]|uniref:SCF E3 ubiquitin ligase complex F-box protein grrA-like n=1 Tax=Aphidius gifuensis TaxID=684658 RepID=UPI001CDCA888|nr:SCF E3 ubiquitin ligase complex F-box protein grrA-like [Aphidius gifuensis]
MHVPACERLKIALVCKKWKRALNDSWFNVKKLELTYWKYHEFPKCLKKYQTADGKLNFLNSLLDKCGRYLTTLDITAYGHCNIVPVINDCCPNLTKLRLRFIDTNDAMLSNAFTRLSKLKSLTIIFQNMKNKIIPVTLINSLKNVADTLMELNLLNFVNHLDDSCDYPKEFNCVIRELKVMKNLEVAGIRVFEDIYKHIIDNKFLFFFNHTNYLIKPPYLSHPLIHIRTLDLNWCYIKNDGLYTIANTIKWLELLEIPCKFITDDGVVALSKMNNLRYIYLNGHSNITDSSIKLLKNIVKVCLPRSNKITDASVTKLLENSPNIDYLFLHDTSVTVDFVKKAAEISNNRKQLLTFIISFIPDLKQYTSEYFKIYTIENIVKKEKK